MDEKSIFNNARQIPNSQVRNDYLKLACGDDTEVLKRIQELLAVNADDSGFLEAPPVDVAETESLKDEKSKIGEGIGPYKLLQEIGEGGMGSVYMAEQTEPIKRRVALKIIKAGMDSKQVIARFEAERQALAMMDHPNIARLLDVGTTDSGRPYFVMELVKGVPITEYCDDKRLSVKQRLELLTSVCNAVQHAHQKGIIHRDLKPSNILVAEYDDKVVPKIIDFGLAKALHQNLTDRTMFTQLGQIVGTLTYMSPEQSKMNQLDVDTRTDIYSLGVLLYELLTGTTPFDAKRLKSAALDQVLKIIREEEPPKPSTRISDSGKNAASISEERQINPSKLRQILKGELDWVVMKALEKDRGRRYQNANALSDDLTRYIDNQTVTARPPSLGYRLSKFATKNRVSLFIAASIFVLAIVTGSLWRYSVVAQRKQNERFTATENTKTQIDSLEATSGNVIPFILENLDGLPRNLVMSELQSRFADANGQHQLKLAYGLAHYGQVEVNAIIAAILDVNTKSQEGANIVRALEGESEAALKKLQSAAVELTKNKDWEKKARLAIIALQLNDDSIAKNMCQQRSDPIQRTIFIDTLSGWYGDLLRLAAAVQNFDDRTLRYSVALGVGSVQKDKISNDSIQAWQAILTNWYRNHADPGIHSAAGWALRQLQLEIPVIAPTGSPAIDQRWHVNQLKITMVMVPAGKFSRFTAVRDPKDLSKKIVKPQVVTITKPFLLSDREISRAAFEQFINDPNTPDAKKPVDWPGADVSASPTALHPVQNVYWHEAVLFCNWLSDQEGLTPCYQREAEDADTFHFKFVPHANGYRLPTDAEWEYACRARTVTKFGFGEDMSFLDSYSVNRSNATDICGNRLPNQWGLFDLHGNVFEYCHDWYFKYPAQDAVRDPIGPPSPPGGGGMASHVVRGGSYHPMRSTGTLSLFSASRNGMNSVFRNSDVGFRVARTPSD